MRPILSAFIALALLPLAEPASADTNDTHEAIHRLFGAAAGASLGYQLDYPTGRP